MSLSLHLGPAAAGLLAYVGGCLLCLTAGLGLQRLLRVGLSPRQALLFAPGATLALLACALGLWGTWHQPVRSLVAPLGVLLTLLAFLGLFDLARWQAALRGTLLALAACLALPLALLAPHFRSGLRDYPGVVVVDGWSYVAYAHYLWEPPRRVAPTPLQAYGSHLVQTRHVSPGLLALLSPVERAGDTQAVVGLFVALALFQCACACAALGSTRRLGPARLVCYLLLAVPAGWLAHALAQSNYDQAVALALHPLLAGAVSWLDPRRGRVLLAALVLAACAFTYPELFGLALLAALLVAGGRWRRLAPVRRRPFALALGGALVAAVVIVAPYLHTAVRFLGWQKAAVEGQARPGGRTFDGLLLPRHALSGFWGLGGETPDGLAGTPAMVLACGLTMLAVAGAVRLARRRRAEPALFAAVLWVAAGVVLVAAGYSYGAYKLFTAAYWALGLCVLSGLDALSGRLRGIARGAVLWGSTGLIALAYGVRSEGCRSLRATPTEGGFGVADFRALERLAEQIRPAGVVIEIEGVAAHQWALYFLRDLPLRVAAYRGYPGMPTIAAGMARARVADWPDVTYVLSDQRLEPGLASQTLKLVASAPPYRLWRWRDDVALFGFSPRTALRRHGPGFTVGPDETRLSLAVRRPGRLTLSARVEPWPGRGRATDARLVVSGRAERALLKADGARHTTRLRVVAGFQEIAFSAAPGSSARVLGLRLGLAREERSPACTGPLSAPDHRLVDPKPIVAQDAQAGDLLFWRPEQGPCRLEAAWLVDGREQLRPEGSGDFDGDGRRDWVLWSPARRRLGLRLSTSPGVLQWPQDLPEVASDGQVASTADVDRDGRSDLVLQDASATVEVWSRMDASAWLRRQPVPPAPGDSSWRLAAAADVDGDGWIDLLWQHRTSAAGVVWYLDAALRRRKAARFDPPEGQPGWRLEAVGRLRERPAVPGPHTDVLWRDAADDRWVLTRLAPDGSVSYAEPLSGADLAPPLGARLMGPR